MTLPKLPPVYLIAAAAVGAAALFVAVRGARGTGQSIGGGAVDFVDGVLTGAVVSVADRVGVPATNLGACARAKAEGRTWDASFACPAGDFLAYLWS